MVDDLTKDKLERLERLEEFIYTVSCEDDLESIELKLGVVRVLDYFKLEVSEDL